MSIQATTAASTTSGGSDPATQSDFQVKQLKSQINDWSTCPTTPPATKKAIVAKLQFQLDAVVQGLEKKQQAVKQANAASAGSAGNVPTAAQPSLAPRYVPPFKVDTYA